MIHHHSIGDARITGVIEYSGPTHAPDFLYPAVDKAERDAVLKANASWLAPNHYVPHMDRLIVTIQLWVLHAGGNVIVIDTGVGNRKPRSAERMDRLNTLVMPWLEVDRRRAGAGDACGDDPPAHRPCRLEHGREGRQMGADLSRRRATCIPQGRVRLLEGALRQGRQGREPGLVRR